MKRRTYLTTILCGGGVGMSTIIIDGDEGEVTEPMSQDDPNNSEETLYTVTSLETHIDHSQLKLEVEGLNTDVTHDNTAKFRLTYTNISDEPLETSLREGTYVPAQYSEDDQVILVPGHENVSKDSPNCWRPTQEQFFTPAVHVRNTLDPGDTVTQEYTLWANPQSNGCLRPGEYHFDVRYGELILELQE